MIVTIEVATRKQQELVDISDSVQSAVHESGILEGVAFVYCPHTIIVRVLADKMDTAEAN